MQTFLPYPDFSRSARVLDNKRLGKQRVEVLQILNVLLKPGGKSGWRNHPAVRMWRGYEHRLHTYGLAVCREWTGRGYKDTCYDKMTDMMYEWGHPLPAPDKISPPWLGDESFHASHRSNLLRKDPVWYGRFGWTEPHDLPYVWPV